VFVKTTDSKVNEGNFRSCHSENLSTSSKKWFHRRTGGNYCLCCPTVWC